MKERTYTEEQLKDIGRHFLLECRLKSRLEVAVTKALRLKYSVEYKALRSEIRDHLKSLIDSELTQFSRDYKKLGMKVVVRRIGYSQRQRAGLPVTTERWTKCSCNHIAQEHNSYGRCELDDCKCSGYDGKWVVCYDY